MTFDELTSKLDRYGFAYTMSNVWQYRKGKYFLSVDLYKHEIYGTSIYLENSFKRLAVSCIPQTTLNQDIHDLVETTLDVFETEDIEISIAFINSLHRA